MVTKSNIRRHCSVISKYSEDACFRRPQFHYITSIPQASLSTSTNSPIQNNNDSSLTVHSLHDDSWTFKNISSLHSKFQARNSSLIVLLFYYNIQNDCCSLPLLFYCLIDSIIECLLSATVSCSRNSSQITSFCYDCYA